MFSIFSCSIIKNLFILKSNNVCFYRTTHKVYYFIMNCKKKVAEKKSVCYCYLEMSPYVTTSLKGETGGGLFKVLKSSLIEYEIFKNKETTTKLGQNNRKHYSQILHLLGKESKEERRLCQSCAEIYGFNLPTQR